MNQSASYTKRRNHSKSRWQMQRQYLLTQLAFFHFEKGVDFISKNLQIVLQSDDLLLGK